jgi:arylsulfatase A-like enzyme
LTIASSSPSAAPAAESLQVARKRPNVVVIMTDDARTDDLRWMPNTWRLIGGQGARFANSFAPYPLCCPARASFLDGQYTHNHGVWSTRDPFGFQAFNDRRTLPVWLRRAGYNTLFVGKYLNGYGRQPTYSGQRRSVRYVPPGWTQWHAAVDGGVSHSSPLFGKTYRYRDMTLNVNGRLQPHQGAYSTNVLGRQSRFMIRQYSKKSKPFFMWASYVAPHAGLPIERDDPRPVRRNDGATTHILTPAVTPGVRGHFNSRIRRPAGLPTERDVSDKPPFMQQPRINRRERAAMLEGARQRAESLRLVDQQVAKTIKTLRATGELSNTIVMFTSDNGYFQGEHRFRQGKLTPYEPALRVPLLMRGPGIPNGVVRHAPFTSIDFAPTILAAAGAHRPRSIDGQALLREARHGGVGWHRPVLTEALYVPKSGGGGNPENWRSSVGLRVPGMFYTEHSTGDVELYNLRRDPKEDHNVAGERAYADRQKRLARILDDLRNCSGKSCRRSLSSW